MASRPVGRPKEFDHRVEFKVDDETKQWLAATSDRMNVSEATLLRSVLRTARRWEQESVARSNDLDQVQVVP